MTRIIGRSGQSGHASRTRRLIAVALSVQLLAAPAVATAGPIQAAPVAEPPRDERELLQGYRDASEEVQEIMLELARKATKKKDFEWRSEKND